MNTNVPETIYAQFRQAGINPPSLLVTSQKIERFPVSPGDRNSGWYIGFLNPTAKGEPWFHFVFGDMHHSEVTHSASNSNDLKCKPSAGNNKDMQAFIARAKEIRRKEREEENRAAAVKSQQRFSGALQDMAPNPYLDKKKISDLFGARLEGQTLLVPMRNIEGEIRNIEQIYFVGGKKFVHGLKGGARDGLFHTMGDFRDVIYICEGFSTAVSVHLAMKDFTVVCFNSGNIEKVALELVKKYKGAKFIFCADNDRLPNENGMIDNVGVACAESAARAIGGKVVVPYFPDDDETGEDWDDIRREYGLTVIAEQIEQVNPLERKTGIDVDFVLNRPYPDETPGTFKRLGTIENVRTMLDRLGYVVRYNVITKDQEILIPNASFTQDNRANATLAEIYSWCERCKIPSGHLISYLNRIADENQFNPVVTWITSRPWDGKHRLNDFFATIKVKNEKDINILAMKEKLMRCWMLSAVAGAFRHDGVSAHGVLVFVGAQNLGKTKWFKRLVPEDLGLTKTGATIRPDDKDSVLKAIRFWLVEVGELDGSIKRSDDASLKAFWTDQEDVVRPPYEKKACRFARRTVFFASVNNIEFLRDPTGNRRYWTLECESIDHSHNFDMQQVWAEIYDRFEKGESWYLTNDEVTLLNEHNVDYQEVSSIEELVDTIYDWSSPVRRILAATQVCKELGFRGDDRDAQKAGHVLRKRCGERCTIPGTKAKGYRVPPLKNEWAPVPR